MTSEQQIKWAQLLQDAVSQPGTISAAYQSFHRFSMGNLILAAIQIEDRKLPFGPIATYPAWQALGRQVRKGEKAIELCMPVTSKRAERDKVTGEETEYVFTRFIFRRNWFLLAQTDGKDYVPEPVAEWDPNQALRTLNISRVPFDNFNGNIMGYATGNRTVAINPVNPHPEKTLVHEIAHIVHGHIDPDVLASDGRAPRSIEELEAEATALLVCDALGIDGQPEMRGYIQAWFGRSPIPETNARRIMHAADVILRAGRGEIDAKENE